jgi:hypothetical protein
LRTLGTRYLAFLNYGFDPQRGRFRNFMSYDRRWLESEGSEDSHGRALWALGTMMGHGRSASRKSLAEGLFHAALPAARAFTSPRAWAFTLLGIDEYLAAFQGDSFVEEMRGDLACRLLVLLPRAPGNPWPWFEESVTYENARLCEAMLVSGARMGDDEMSAAGLRTLEWLTSLQRSVDGYFAPIGSNGFYHRAGVRAEFDQQPIEACATVAACLVAARVTGERRWRDEARRAFGWFLGQNQKQLVLCDATTGGCRDGLHVDRVNENQGAESTLSYLIALTDLRAADRAQVAPTPPASSASRGRAPAFQPRSENP